MLTRLLFGAGSMSEGTKNTVFTVFLVFYFNQVLGLSGTLSGAAIFIALCFDALIDPVIGSLSDHTRSRLGRRHPWMYAAVIPMPVFFVFLFNPPEGLGQLGLFAWLTLFAMAVRAAMALYAIPSGAMVPELTSDYDERTSLMSYRFLFGFLGGLGASLLGYLVYFAHRDGVDGRLVPDSYGAFSVACAVIMAVSILTCALGTHGLIPKMRRPPTEGFSLAGLFREIRVLLANRSYRTVVIGLLFAAAAAGFNDVVGLYVSTFYWEFTSQEIASFVGAVALAVVIAAPAARPLSERLGKKRAALWLCTFAILFGPLPIFLRLLDWMPANREPLLFWLMFGHAAIVVAVVFAVSIIVASMITDVVDQHELDTGKRQEGLIVSAIAFTQKAASGVGGFVAGVALDVIAFPKGAIPGAVPPEKLTALGLAVGPGLLAFYFLLLFFLNRYEITRESHVAVLEELDRRRQAAG